uniref:Peptidase S1 domain-containing protein n=1 Tax=Anopheles melas TaxID=34690 RepID=A0A182U5D5_9DIPT
MMPNVRESLDEWKFKEAECALRYVHLRQYQKQVLIDQTDSFDVVTPARRRLEPRYTDAMVEIRYGGYSVSREDCYGLIIDEDTVLTLAQCTTNHGKRATFVMYMGNERNTVVNHYNHPGYREEQYYNNIGLLKVRSRFVFFGSFVPFCIWHENDLADSIVELTGHGRRDLNYFSLHNASVDVFEPQNFQLIARANVIPINKCSYPEEFSKNLSNGLTGEHLCFGNEDYLVPETCQQAAGGPIGGKKFKFNKQFRYAYALNSFGRDCGFGRAAVGVRFSSHIGWLQSVLLPDHRKDSGSVHFLHSELEENDTCRHVDGAPGLCVEATRCPKIRYDFSANRQVVFCQTSTVVCCPYENMVNETTISGRELDECADRIKANGTTDSYVYPTAMYNRDCEALEEGLSSNQLCVDVQPHDTKVSLGDLLFWSEVMDDGTQVQYLVGIMSHVTAGDRTVNVHSRISSYYKYGKTSIIKPAFGQTTYLREFAHMAAIGWTQPDGTITWNCGGSLIWENYILTAAHCVEDAQQNAPDVARFGDLDLFNATDNQYAQQLKIVEIIRHPEHRHRDRYHDIALMRLEREVMLHDTVAPACLWTDDEIRFKQFEATGWGDTGFAAEKTPILLKVALSPVANEKCNVHYLNLRGLRNGLHTNQLCAGDVRMDTCPGDSGGPLQVKLLHNTRETPFLVGVTSFGLACGLSVPGVYTRVAPYVPWIRSVLKDRGENATEWNFQPQACALRYAKYREFEPRVLLHKSQDSEQIDLSEAHLFSTASRQLAAIHWNGTDDSEQNDCFGVIVDDIELHNGTNCTQHRNETPTEHLCFGAKPFLVPSTCHQSLGGPLEREVGRFGRSLPYVYALNLAGRDCGYGESALGVRLASHLVWFNSILFPQRVKEDPGEAFIFLNNDLEEGDTCAVDGVGMGVCTSAVNCPRMLYRFQQNQPVRFCGSGSVLCCPREDVRNALDSEWREIDSCATRRNSEEEDFDPRRHMVSLDLSQGIETQTCIGTMISNRTFLTAASCLEGKGTLKYVTLDNREIQMVALMVVEKVTVHPEYDSTTKRNNIALITVMHRTEIAFGKSPICLWSNQTHTPFYLEQVGLTGRLLIISGLTHNQHTAIVLLLVEEPSLGPALAFTKFNSDCDRTFRRTLDEHELCVDVEQLPYMDTIEVDEGMPAFWKGRGNGNYLIGIASHSAPNDSSVFLHTRVAPYVGWIKSVL